MILQIPKVFEPVWRDHNKMFVVCYGGRASGKSWDIAQRLVAHALEGYRTIVCLRQFQKSIRYSSKRVIERQIKAMGVSHLFVITDQRIVCMNGSEFLFEGMDRSYASLKSLEGADYCWLEEGQYVSHKSLDVLLPTIREGGSVIYVSINPENADDAVYDAFLGDKPDYEEEDMLLINANWPDNPFNSRETFVKIKAAYRKDREKAKNIWGGQLNTSSNALVFQPDQWRVGELTPPENCIPMFGLDIGIKEGLTAFVQVWQWENYLFVDKEIYHEGPLEVQNIGAWLEQLAPLGATIISDTQTPIGNYQGIQAGFQVMHALKGAIYEGINWMKQYDIVVSSKCAETIREFQTWKYETDPRTDAVLKHKFADGDDHCLDAIRYAIEPLMLAQKDGGKEQSQWSRSVVRG